MERLDQAVAKLQNITRNKAQNLIKDGYVFVDDVAQNKPSFMVDSDEKITIKDHDEFVSRGAYKLIKALDEFEVDVKGKCVLDMGASTGGFTQVLLTRGANKVFSVDVGKGELDKKLRLDKRVVNMEGRDIRSIAKEEVQGVSFVVGDLSFISLKNILPHVNSIFGGIEMVLLFKPQFECGKEIARKYRGVIKDKAVHKKLLNEFAGELQLYGFTLSNLTHSPIKGGSGNIEYLVHLNGKNEVNVDINKIVNDAFGM